MQTAQQLLSKVTGGSVAGISTLPTAKLGKNGPQVQRLGYGAMGLVCPSPQQMLLTVNEDRNSADDGTT